MLKKGVLLMLSLMWGADVFGQDSLSLDLPAVREQALKYNSQIRKAGLSLQEAQKMLWESIAQGLPQASGTVDYSNFLGAKMSIMGQSMSLNPTSNAALQVTQLVFSGNYFVGLQIAKLYEGINETNTKKTELDVIEQVTNTYYAILIAEKSLSILQQNLENVKDLYKRTESLSKVGVIEDTEVLQLSVQVTNLENAIKSAERQLEITYNMMRLQLGIKMESPLTVVGSIDDLASGVDVTTMVGQTFDISKNLDFQLVEGQEAMKEKQVMLQKMNYLPTISAYYSYTYKVLKPEFDMSPKNVVGLQANIPIFSSGMRKAGVDKAKIQLKSTQIDKELLMDNLYIQSKQVKNNLQTYYEQYQSQLKNVTVTKTIFNKFARKFEHGMTSGIDLTASNNSYLTAESSLLSSMLQLLQAKSEFEKLYGTEK